MSLALTALGTGRWYAGHVAEARALRERAVAIARETGDAHALASALDGYARLLNTSGLPDEAMAAAEEALPLAEAAGLELVAIGIQTTIGSVRALASADGRELLRSAAQRSLVLADLDSYTRARNNLQYALWRIGDLDAAEREAEETMEQIAQYRLPTITAWMAANVAWSLVQRGRWDAALEKAAEYERTLRGRSFYLDPHLEAGIVIIRLARGEPEPLSRLRELVDVDGDVMDGQSDVAPLACLAVAEALADNAAEAERIVRKIAPTPPSMREHVACIGAWLGPLAALTGVDLLEGIDAPGRWLDANLAFVQEGFAAGIAILDEMEARGESAAIRLLALKAGRGEHPWAGEVEAFAREVGATRWLRDLAGLAPTRRSA
jgi:tetratricopeptide (TPR) repeat protein